MFRPTARRILSQSAPRNVTRTTQTRRFLSTAPPHEKSRSWKNSALRWTLAGSLVYYYNTSSVFAEEPSFTVHAPPEISGEADTQLSLDAVVARREALAKAQAQKEASRSSVSEAVVDAQVPAVDAAAPGSPDELEEEASQQGAFNEETGEINWDCPCLGGMAHGPCGDEFREAFSCFVYSKEEPKGVDCIDRFKNMQNCFREHPDIYGAELDDDEEPELEVEGSSHESATASGVEPSASPAGHQGEKVSDGAGSSDAVQGKRERSQAASAQVKSDFGEQTSETKEIVPKAWHESK